MKKYILIAFAAALTFTACQDFLTKDPIMSQSTELTLSDYNGLNKSVAGAYAPLVSVNWYGADLVLDAEMRAGNAVIPTNSNFTSGRLTLPYNMTYLPTSTEALWGTAYYLISACNNVINAIDTKGEALLSNSVDQQDIDNIKAEALALRAFAHFDLLRTYGFTGTRMAANAEYGVPVIIAPQSPMDMPARATVEETFTQIIADFTAAESLMADGYSRSGVADSKAVLNKTSIQALLARVYLYHQDWQKAADYATLVINSGKYTMWSADQYCSVWGEDTGSGEVIFEVYGKQANSYDGYWEGPSHMTNPCGYADCAADGTFVKSFEAGDVRGTTGIHSGKKADGSSADGDEGTVMFVTDVDEASGGQMWSCKYYGKGEGDAYSTPDVSNTIVIRLSEMYLIRAEAAEHGANTGSSAVADLNVIRSNRGATLLTSGGFEAVASERRLELNFEGHYWFDLARTGKSITYSDGAKRKIDGVPADSKFWAMPIPKGQIDINTNLKQNPGYDE